MVFEVFPDHCVHADEFDRETLTETCRQQRTDSHCGDEERKKGGGVIQERVMKRKGKKEVG